MKQIQSGLEHFCSKPLILYNTILAPEKYHQATQYDIHHSVWDGGAEDFTILALHIASGSGDGDALRTNHLAARSTRGIGSYQPIALATLHTKESTLTRHAELVGNMSLKFGKEDIG